MIPFTRVLVTSVLRYNDETPAEFRNEGYH